MFQTNDHCITEGPQGLQERLGSHSKNVILFMVTAIGKLDRHNKNWRFVAQHRWMIGNLLFLEVGSSSHWQYFENS